MGEFGTKRQTPADQVVIEATRVFRSEDLAQVWLRSRIAGLDNERPLDLLASTDGLERVMDALGKIEYGMY